jgi:ribonucleoside-diphosphate reductase alpha subunit
MQVIKRDGRLEAVHFEKITNRLRKLCVVPPAIPAADVSKVAQHACAAIYDRIKTETLDHITADAAIALATEHPDYSALAARVLVSDLQKNTHASVLTVYANLQHVVSPEFSHVIHSCADTLDAMLDFSRDFKFDYFGFKTLQKAYLLKGERPQHMYLRVAVGLWGMDMERVSETYDALSTHQFTLASPTLFNSGTKTPQLSSCFLLGVHTDSLDTIFETMHKAATISKYGGGIGMHVSSIRGKGSLIKSTNGTSDGLVPMLKVANEVFKYVNQCFVPTTRVYTSDGMKEIQDVLPGNKVQTKDASYKEVNDVFVREVVDEDVVTLVPDYGHPITCTKIHDIYIKKSCGGFPEFIQAGHVDVGDCVGFPNVHCDGGMMYTPIIDITFSKYTGKVYDLNVQENHNYTTEGGLVHNSGKRKGSCAIYIEPHHADIMAVLDLKRNQGDDHLRARDLFYAMWISDLFMERVEADAEWSLFDPGTSPGLEDVWGDDYKKLYVRYENEGRAVKTMPAQDVWFAILRSQIETGVPYMVYKDAANSKSNQQHLGTIKCSNLCSEIIEYTAPDEIAVCNLGSLSLPEFVSSEGYTYDGLHAATKLLARNLDRVIDVTFYPVSEAENSNLRHRPIGIGVQGLADVFFKMKIPFDSPEAADINRKIFATVYHAAVETSCDIVDERSAALDAGLLSEHPWYPTFKGSPASYGRLQIDLWGVQGDPMYDDWNVLRQRAAHGMRNSLLVAPMPTASTAQILGNTEAFEPITSNLYSRTTMAGTFTVVNKYLLEDLMKRGLWTPLLKQQLVAAEGSVQSLDIPDDLKKIYKTAYELSMKTIIDMAADRGCYVDQSMSLNMFVAEPTFRKLSSMHFYSWKKGLKTGMYYLRSHAASSAKKITVEAYSNADCVMCSG